MRLAVHIFNRYTRALWVAIAVITVVSEVIPIPRMIPLVHYGVYSPAKLVCFLLIGFLTPLAFARLNALNRGIAFAALSAAIVEVLQGLVGNGHSFHWYELGVKWAIILVGFMIGLDARYENGLSLGILRIRLVPDVERKPIP